MPQQPDTIPFGFVPDLDDSDVSVTEVIFLPLLVEPEPIPDLKERRPRAGEAPRRASLSSLVSEIIPLNRKEAMVVLARD